MTLELSWKQSAGRIKGNQATFDNSQQNNLRPCVCGFGGGVGEDVRTDFSLLEGEILPFYLRVASVRGGDLDLDSPEVQRPYG